MRLYATIVHLVAIVPAKISRNNFCLFSLGIFFCMFQEECSVLEEEHVFTHVACWCTVVRVDLSDPFGCLLYLF